MLAWKMSHCVNVDASYSYNVDKTVLDAMDALEWSRIKCLIHF